MTNEELVEQIQNGINTQENMGILYKQNFGFIRKIVRPYSSYAEMDDLMQEAYFGLLNAVKNFDISKDLKFTTYAFSHIRQSSRRYVDNYSRTNRIPVYMLEQMREYKKLSGKPYMTGDMIKKKLGLTDKKYDFLIQTINQEKVIPLDTPIRVKSGDNLTIGDCIADSTDMEQDTIESDCKSRLWELIGNVLNDKQSDVITSYFLNEQSYTEIAKKMGCSRERINQIKKKAISILKEIKELQDLAEFWGYDSMMAYSGKNSVEQIVMKKLEYEESIQQKTAQLGNTMLAITKNQQDCIVERINELCKERKISKRQLEKEAGLGTGSISKWNKFRPRKASLQRVADYFGVELEFLIGNS